ncbi:MAG: Crp/Fnr family transcriptional regulator [Prevotella sp.]|nr:Crp/Fnr family transcriptional regulator [Prevotella sp.]
MEMPAAASFQLYEHLLQFQFFQGLSRSELLQIAGNTKFGFQKTAKGKTVVREYDNCHQLLFLISGRLSYTTQSDTHSYALTEHLAAPWLLQPEALFGAATQFTATVTTETDCHFITLSKDEVMRLLDDFLIIRLNLLNLLSTQVQRRSRRSWRRAPADVQQLIVRFLLDRCVYPAGPKEVAILMRQLAQELNATRLEVSQALNSMQDAGLLTLRRGRIVIPLMEHLVM